MTAGAWMSKLRTERKVAKILNARCYLLYNGLAMCSADLDKLLHSQVNYPPTKDRWAS